MASKGESVMKSAETWMVIVRWKGGRDNKPPAGHAIHMRCVSEPLARSAASVMRSMLPAGCSAIDSAEMMPEYLT